jgi:hypothetical protein
VESLTVLAIMRGMGLKKDAISAAAGVDENENGNYRIS